jgi:hypothetical protein
VELSVRFGDLAAATPERPHRQASIVECPESLQPVSRTLLESLAAAHVPEPPTLKIPANDQLKVEWLRGFLEHFNIPVIGERQNGQRYFLDVEAHGGRTPQRFLPNKPAASDTNEDGDSRTNASWPAIQR